MRVVPVAVVTGRGSGAMTGLAMIFALPVCAMAVLPH
jgi:hypothetical protein